MLEKKRPRGEAGYLNPEGMCAALCVDGFVHSLEADCWSRIYSICQKTLLGSPGCFGLLPQQRKYRLSILIRCPQRVFYCWKTLLCHVWRNEEWRELKIVMIPSVCRKSSMALLITSMNRQFLGSLSWVLESLKVSTVTFLLFKFLTFSGTCTVNCGNLKQMT